VAHRYRAALTDNATPGTMLRVRIKDLPKPGEFDEYDLRRYGAGETHDIPTSLGSMLIIAGYAELAVSPRVRDVAADKSRQSRSRR